MFSTDSAFYRLATWIYTFALLNVLFLIVCLPVVTIPASTAALFGVVRKLIRGDDSAIFRQFFKQFAGNFKQSLIAGWILFLIGVFGFMDFHMAQLIHSALGVFVTTILLLIALLYISVIIHIYPLMVHGYFTLRDLFTNAIKISLYKFHLTVVNIVLVVVLAFVCLQFPFLYLFFFFSLAAYLTYWIVNLKFKKVFASEKKQDEISAK